MTPKKALFGKEKNAAGIGLKTLIAITSLRGMHRLLVVQGTVDRKQQHIIQKCCIVLDAATSIDAAATSDVTGCPSLMAGVGVPTFKKCADLGNVMHSKGFTVGVKLGVQNGYHSRNAHLLAQLHRVQSR